MIIPLGIFTGEDMMNQLAPLHWRRYKKLAKRRTIYDFFADAETKSLLEFFIPKEMRKWKGENGIGFFIGEEMHPLGFFATSQEKEETVRGFTAEELFLRIFHS